MMLLLISLLCSLSLNVFCQVILPSNKVIQFYVPRDQNYSTSCFILELNGKLNLYYKDKKGINQEAFTYINHTQFDNDVNKATGICSKTSNEMYIKWPIKANVDSKFQIYINSNSLNESGISYYQLNKLEFNTSITEFKGLEKKNKSVITLLSTTKLDHMVRNNSYYYCESPLYFNFQGKFNVSSSIENAEDEPNTWEEIEFKATLTTDHLKFQAWRPAKSNDSFIGPMDDCAIDKLSNNIVPLIVGGILSVMVAIVLITYLIGRRRHRSSYQTI